MMLTVIKIVGCVLYPFYIFSFNLSKLDFSLAHMVERKGMIIIFHYNFTNGRLLCPAATYGDVKDEVHFINDSV